MSRGKSSGILEALWNERRAAREQLREIVHIRVTPAAIAGSLTTTPLTPERARVLGKLLAVADEYGRFAGVVGAPENERLLEIVMHPQDWAALCRDAEAIPYVELSGDIDRVAGIPVSR